MRNILIIDDDVCIGDMVEEVLTREGYSASRAYSGTEALLYLSGHRPDLILLDLMLPGLSGEELLPRIKDIPVIVVSAKADVSDKVDLLLGGAAVVGYLVFLFLALARVMGGRPAFYERWSGTGLVSTVPEAEQPSGA